MSKSDGLKEEIGVLKEEFKNFFLLFMAIRTGSITTFYQVILQRIPFYIIFISLSGFVASLFIIVLMRRVRIKLDKLIEELKESD